MKTVVSAWFLVLAVVAPLCAQGKSAPRRTPLGTQADFPLKKLKDDEKLKVKAPAAVLEPVTRVLERAVGAHGGRQRLAAVVDSVAEGTFTSFAANGSGRTLPLTVVTKGDKVQRTIRQPGGELRQGSDGGRTWDGIAGHRTSVRNSGLSFIEIQTVRSALRLFDHQLRGARLKDFGIRGARRALEVEDPGGRTTTYLIEPNGRVGRVEFHAGVSRNPFSGRTMPVVEAFEFSDYRMVQGVLTPMTVTHFRDGIKLDVMEFGSVRYDSAVSNGLFRP